MTRPPAWKRQDQERSEDPLSLLKKAGCTMAVPKPSQSRLPSALKHLCPGEPLCNSCFEECLFCFHLSFKSWPVHNLVVKVRHVDAHVPKNRATEEHQNNQQVDQAAKIEVAQVHLDWQHKGELFIARWAHDTSGHQGRDATYRWARDRGMELTMDTIAQVIHDCETCAAIKQAKRLKPPWYGGRWLKYKYGEAWQIGYITVPQTHNGKR